METRKLPNDRHDPVVLAVVKLDEGDFGGGTPILPGDCDEDCRNSFKLLVVLVGVWGSTLGGRLLLLLSTADDWKD